MLEAVGFPWWQKSRFWYTPVAGPLASRPWVSSRQKPTFWPGATSAVMAWFHSEYRAMYFRWKWLWPSSVS